MIIGLTTLDIVNGTFSLIFSAIAIIIGLLIASRYFKHKQRVFLFVGFAWMGMSEPWLSSGISFLMAGFTGKGLSPTIYAIIGVVFIPVSILLWLAAFTNLAYEKKQKLILIIFVIYGIIFEIIFFYLLSLDPGYIVILNGPVDAEYQTFIRIYLISMIATILITGILFARESLKSENPEIKLKGKLLLAAFLSWSIGAIFDGTVPINLITLTIVRLLLISSVIEFYCGFLLPNWLKKRVTKQE